MAGKDKLLLPFAETTILGATCTALSKGGAASIIIVIRDDDVALRTWTENHRFQVAVNARPQLGMLASIQAGIEVMGDGASSHDGLLVSPGDLPLLQASSVQAVVDQAQVVYPFLVVPSHRQKRGHPLFVPPSLVQEVLQLDLELGLRQLLQHHPDEVAEVEVDDPGIYLDVDTSDDYEKILLLREASLTGQ